TGDLEWTGSPRIVLGYQLANNMGQLLATHRSVVSEGTGTLPAFDNFGDGFLRSRLNMNVVDLDYASGPQAFASLWTVNWNVGARIAGAYFDSTATCELVSQHLTHNFFGAGPRAGLEVTRPLPGVGGPSLFGRLDGSG